MIKKQKEKIKAISLRKKGMTYGDILALVPVSRSTLSLWLREVGLARKQYQRLTVKKRKAQLRGGMRRKEMRLSESESILSKSKSEVGSLSSRELKLIGAALYWAEGTKEKEYRPSARLQFANSDPSMVALYMLWLRRITGVSDKDVIVTVHIHDNHRSIASSIERYWLKVTNLSRTNLGKTVFKKHNPKTLRKNIGLRYRGLVSISVRKSTSLNRRVQGWINGIIEGAKI